MEKVITMDIFQKVFCALLAYRIFDYSKVLASLSCNLIQKVYKKSLFYNMKLKEKRNKLQFSRMTLITRVLIIFLPFTSALLWVLVFYYSTFDDDAKAAVLSYIGCASIIFTTKYVFVKNANLVSLNFFNYLAFFFINAGCLLLPKFYTMAFYAVCLGILLNKMKYEVEQIRPDYFFEDTEVSHGNSPDNFTNSQDLTVEEKEDPIMYSDNSKIKDQRIGSTESIIQDIVEIDQSAATKEKEENIFQFEKHVSENNFHEKPKEPNQLYDDSNKSKLILEGLFSEKMEKNFVFKFSNNPELVDKDKNISDASTKVSECRKNKIEEIGQNNDLRVSLLTPDFLSNSFINSTECTSNKTGPSLSKKEVNGTLDAIFDRDLFVDSTNESELLDYQNENNKDISKDYSGEKFWENIIYQISEFQPKLSNKVNDVITSNTSRENNFDRISGKRKSSNSNESFANKRQQMIDKVCEDIKSKVKCSNIQIPTDFTDETDQCELNIPLCIINKSDQLSPQNSVDMNKTSPNKHTEPGCFNSFDFSTSNEQFEYESKSSVKYTQMQKSGNESSSINPLMEPEAKSTFTTDFECCPNSNVKQVTSLEKQYENGNSDFVINEEIDESAAIVSTSATLWPSAISNVEGIVNTIDMSFIYAGPSFPY